MNAREKRDIGDMGKEISEKNNAGRKRSMKKKNKCWIKMLIQDSPYQWNHKESKNKMFESRDKHERREQTKQ